MSTAHVLPACGMVFAAYAVAAGLLNRRHRQTGKPSLEAMRWVAICGAVILIAGVSLAIFAR